jgi:hypothetical protein
MGGPNDFDFKTAQPMTAFPGSLINLCLTALVLRWGFRLCVSPACAGRMIVSHDRQLNFSRHMLGDEPLPRDDIERLGDILADPGELAAAAARACGRSRVDNAPARQMLRKVAARRLAPTEPLHLDPPSLRTRKNLLSHPICKLARASSSSECGPYRRVTLGPKVVRLLL